MEIERSLVLLKPDALQRGISMELLARFECRGLKLVGLKLIHIPEAIAQRHYAIHKDKFFFDDLVQFITSGPVIAAVIEGPRAIKLIRDMVGATRPHEAQPGTIRGDYGLEALRNLVHASDSTETADAEMALYFKEHELFTYDRATDPWLYE